MYEVFADLHIHIGRSENNKPIKITAAKSLNFANIAKECRDRKGINIAGIIDCASPYVIEDIESFLKTGEAYEIKDGGIIYKDKVCIILGSEIETSETGINGNCGSAHNICFFPHLKDIKGFSNEMSKHIKNITLSSQRADISAYDLIDIVEKYNGILIPAHCFTPHKSFYGNCTDRLEKIFKEKYNKVLAIELGLSSDTNLADNISELEGKTFLTNSDAHSLPKIAREYNKILVEDIRFKELLKVTRISGMNLNYTGLLNIDDELIPKFKSKIYGELVLKEKNVFTLDIGTEKSVFEAIGIFGLFEEDKINANSRLNKLKEIINRLPNRINEYEYENICRNYGEKSELIEKAFSKVNGKKYCKKN